MNTHGSPIYLLSKSYIVKYKITCLTCVIIRTAAALQSLGTHPAVVAGGPSAHHC
jgi:hypothetical protein